MALVTGSVVLQIWFQIIRSVGCCYFFPYFTFFCICSYSKLAVSARVELRKFCLCTSCVRLVFFVLEYKNVCYENLN